MAGVKSASCQQWVVSVHIPVNESYIRETKSPCREPV
jgi:hypothetical protein